MLAKVNSNQKHKAKFLRIGSIVPSVLHVAIILTATKSQHGVGIFFEKLGLITIPFYQIVRYL